MTTPLYKPLPKNAAGAKPPLASDVGQFVDTLNGATDIGQITLAQPIQTPSTTGITAAATAGTGLGIGAYLYKLTFVTGIIQGDNTAIPGGETPGSSSISVTTTSGNQQVTLSGLPAVTAWPTTAIGINVYRTAVSGADGTQKLIGTIYTNYARTAGQATFVDSITDANLGRAVPTVNTTGTAIAGMADYNQYASLPDSNNLYTVVQYKRPDGTLFMKSTASNPDVNGNYQTVVWQYYDATGATVIYTKTWTITYDSYGKITQKVWA